MAPPRCVRCDTPMRPHAPGPRNGVSVHRGRGLCERCYGWLQRRRRLGDFPLITRRGEDVVQEVEFVREGGRRGLPELADALGMKPTAVQRALIRHGRPDLARK